MQRAQGSPAPCGTPSRVNAATAARGRHPTTPRGPEPALPVRAAAGRDGGAPALRRDLAPVRHAAVAARLWPAGRPRPQPAPATGRRGWCAAGALLPNGVAGGGRAAAHAARSISGSTPPVTSGLSLLLNHRPPAAHYQHTPQRPHTHTLQPTAVPGLRAYRAAGCANLSALTTWHPFRPGYHITAPYGGFVDTVCLSQVSGKSWLHARCDLQELLWAGRMM